MTWPGRARPCQFESGYSPFGLLPFLFAPRARASSALALTSTPLTIRRITNLRNAGWGYKSIAEFCGLTRDQVRSYCQRNDITASRETNDSVCAWCGQALEGRTSRAKYCAPACRWESWCQSTKTRSSRTTACAGCGDEFAAVKTSQKYCCHACYVRARFGTRGGRK